MDQKGSRKGKEPIINLNDDYTQENYGIDVDVDSYDDSSGINIISDNECGTNNQCNEEDFGIGNNDDGQNFSSDTGKRLCDLTIDEVFSMTFNSIEDGETFYNSYAKMLGFSVRKDNVKRDKNSNVVSRRWVCAKEGHRAEKHFDRLDRQQEARAITRVGCLAAFRIGYNRQSNEWDVKEFVAEHNHPMVASHYVQFLRSHRSIKNPDKAQVNAMRGVGVKTNQVMDYMVDQSGGYENVGFTKKDLYNHVDSERRAKIKDGDAVAALAYLSAKAELDPSFYYKYTVDGEGHLENLYWVDSRSRLDYACFGDVLAFDTTYRTNAYKKPFVILLGVNHHHQTTIFSCALLVDETVETYVWVLETLLEAMNSKKPISVITDGDKAMRRAIRRIIPESRHRLCAWHLQRNCVSNIKTPGVSGQFNNCMLDLCTPQEFEARWNAMVETYGLQNNRWISEIYPKRHRWAEAYLRGQFFAGMRTTQRCEGMNAYLNQFLKTRLRLYEFMHTC